MATAKKKKTTKSVKIKSKKKGGAKKKSTPVTDIDSVFSVAGGLATKKKESKKKDAVRLPTNLRELCDIMVASRVVTKAVKTKGEIAEGKVKNFAIATWCSQFVKTGSRPASCTYLGEDTQFDFIQTKRMDMSHSKIQGLQLLGFDPLEKDDEGEEKHVILKGVNIDLEAARKVGGKQLQDKIKKALAKVLEEHVTEVLTSVVSFKDGTLNNLVNLSRGSLDAGASDTEVLERLQAIMSIIQPRTQIRNANSITSDSECFSLVVDSDILNEN